MADLTGRCQNVEYCANAASQRVITVPAADPFVCPKCGEKLVQSRLKRLSTKRQLTLGVQVLVLVAGASAVAYKLTAGAAAPAAAATGDAMASAIPAAPAPPTPDATPASTPAVQDQAATLPAAAPATMLVRMAGSDVIARKLARRLASGYLALIGDSDISLAQLGGGDTANSVAVVANQAGEHEGIAITAASSADGFHALLRGTADIALSSRPPNAAEIEQLAAVGDLTNPASEHVIAVQGLAAIVSPVNHVTSLTVAQLHDIFTGKIHDWWQVGGSPGPIQIFLPDESQGGHDTAADVVLAGEAPTPAAQRLQSTAIAARVATDRAGIALVGLQDAGTARILSVGEPGTVPVTPSDLSISTEDYPLTRRLYFYNGASPGNVVRRFTDYVASPAGQAAVEAAGFVPLTVKAETVAVPDTASSRFRTLVAGATRLSVDFRFQPGSTTLDSRSARDLERLATYLRAQHAVSGRLILAGFADGQGEPAANMAVSTRRTEAVAAALQAVGVTPAQAASFGAELPVADNATPAGRERNRRVEAYLANP